MISKKSCSFFKKSHIKFASCLMLAGILLGGLALSHNTYAEEIVPDVGTKWINVKLPLSMSYYSTADSHHKTITSRQYKIENLSSHPVDVKLTGFVGGDGISPADTRGVEELKLNVSDTQFSRLVFHGKRISYDKNKQNSLYTLGAAGSGTDSIGTFNFSGTTASDVDLSKPILLQNQLNFTLTGLEQDGSIPQDKSSLQIKNVTIEAGNSWKPSLNFVGGTNEYGENLTFNQVTVLGAEKVNTNEPGQYEVVYTYRNVSEKAKVIVLDKTRPKLNKGSGGIDFANRSWFVIKGPDQMGEGNYMIVVKQSIGWSRFSHERYASSRPPYFPENQASSNGYESSLIKENVDNWYNSTVKGTDLEKYVVPVRIKSPTLGEMGWPSNTTVNKNYPYTVNNRKWYDVITPNSNFSTKVDETYGQKQAFVLSAADVSVNDSVNDVVKSASSNDHGMGCDLTSSAKYFLSNLKFLGSINENLHFGGTWLREPGPNYLTASALSLNNQWFITRNEITEEGAVCPAIVVHLDSVDSGESQ